MTKFIFKTDGRYLGFIYQDNLFSRDNQYLGWIENGFVWDSQGQFRGQVMEISGHSYILKNTLAVPPLPKIPKVPPSPPPIQLPQANILPIVPLTGYKDGF